MKLLVLNYEYPPLGGGAGNATYYLLNSVIGDSDLSIDLVTSSADSFRVEEVSENITIHFLDIGKQGNLHHQSFKDLIIYSAKAFHYSKRLLKQNSYDLIHSFFGIPCGYLAMNLGLPYIVSLRGSDVPFHNARYAFLDRLFFARLSRRVWKRALFVVANSKSLKERARETAPAQSVEVIPNGIDSKEFSPDYPSSSNSFRRSRSKLLLIAVGRLSPIKGYDRLIRSLSGMSGIELTLVGDGPERRNLETLAEQLGVNVSFVGLTPHCELPEIYRNHDLYVMSSLNEGMSNTVLEAMACGLPIITTRVGGSEELLQGNGFIINTVSESEIESVIKKYIDEPSLLDTQGRRSREIAEGKDWFNIAKQYKGLYRRI